MFGITRFLFLIFPLLEHLVIHIDDDNEGEYDGNDDDDGHDDTYWHI